MRHRFDVGPRAPPSPLPSIVDPTTPETATADVHQHLAFELSHEPAVSLGAQGALLDRRLRRWRL